MDNPDNYSFIVDNWMLIAMLLTIALAIPLLSANAGVFEADSTVGACEEELGDDWGSAGVIVDLPHEDVYHVKCEKSTSLFNTTEKWVEVPKNNAPDADE